MDNLHFKVAELREWNGNLWVWKPLFSGVFLSGTAAAQLEYLMLLLLLLPVSPLREDLDRIVWWRDASGFSISNAYNALILSLPSNTVLDSFRVFGFFPFVKSESS